MKLQYNEIKVKKRVLINKGEVSVPNKGVCQIKGKNGSGKTLLLHHLFDQYRDSLAICLLNQTNGAVFKDCSILENISMSSDDGVRENVITVLKQFHLESILNLNPKTLSGGEKRLVSILRAVTSDADIILMDEPTNDLSYQTVNILIQILQYYKKQKLFIVVSHDDRLDAIADMLYHITDRQLVLEKKDDGIDTTGSLSSKQMETDQKFLYMRLKRNYLLPAITLLFLFGMIFCENYAEKVEIEKYPETYENQVDIYIPLSSNAIMYNVKGAISTINLRYLSMDGDIEIRDILEYVENAKDAERMAINYGLELESAENYTVYKMEYYDAREKRHFMTLDTYVQETYGADAFINGVGIDTEGVFSYRQETQPTEFRAFDETEFRKAEAVLAYHTGASGEPLKVLHMIVLLKEGYSFQEFVSTKEVQNLTRGNFYIYSNETIALSNLVNSYYTLKRIFEIFVAVILLTVVFYLLVSYVILYSKKQSIINFRDYNVPAVTILNTMQTLYENKMICLICPVILLIYMVFISGDIKAVFTGYHLGIFILFVMIESLLYKWNKIIFRRGIQKMYGWRYRC